MNAPVTVPISGESDPLEVRLPPQLHMQAALQANMRVCDSCGLQIAIKELKEKKIPFTIRRYLPDGR
jgi:hypothetical protein